jgi:selenoprotein W-related protein
MADMLKIHELQIDSFTLIPSDGGRFEVTIDSQLIYSKLKTNRHIQPGEGVNLMNKYLQEGK